jgi:hypothetical protein
MLQDPQELDSTSYYFEALCAFLRESDLKLAQKRTEDCPLRLEIYVSDEDGDNQNRSNLFITETTSRICRSFWENERTCTADFVILDLCVIPSRAVVELFRFGRNSNNSSPNTSGRNSDDFFPQNPFPRVTIHVSDQASLREDLHEDPPWFDHDKLILDVLGMRFIGVESPYVANVADFVLESSFPDLETYLHAEFFSAQAAAALTASLVRNKHSGFSDIGLTDSRRTIHVTSEIPDLLKAVLQCPSVTDLKIIDSYFNKTIVTDLRETFSNVGPASVLSTLGFLNCMISDRDHGFCSLATTMTPSRSLCQLYLQKCYMTENDMTSLCSILARSEWPLDVLSLGNESFDDNLSIIEHFFQVLPSMKTLKRLHLHNFLPPHRSRIVLDGIKNNYWLHDVTGFIFHTAQLNDEMNLYTSANAKGRTVIYEAVTNLSNQEYRQMNEEAITVLLRLSNSSNQEDQSILFLCVQLLLSH